MKVSRDWVVTDHLVELPVNERFMKIPIQNFLKEEGITPNPPQIAILNAINDPRSKFIVACISRRVGKSFIAYTIAFLKALEPNQKILIVAPNYSLANIGWLHINGLVRKYALEVEKANAKDRELILSNGTLIKLGSVERPDSLVGHSYSLAVWEEAALSDKAGDVFNIQVSPTLDLMSSKSLWISTPRSSNYFKDFYERGFSPDPLLNKWVSIHGTYLDNPRADLESIEQARITNPPAFFRQEFEADFSVLDGAVYASFDESIHVLGEEAELELLQSIGKYDAFILGVDIGFKDATSVVAVHYNEETEVFTIVDEYEESGKTTGQYAENIQRFVDNYDPDFIFVDSAAAQFRADLAYEYDITSQKAKKSVLDGLGFVETLLHSNKLKVLPKCTGVIAMFKNYRWDEKAVGKERPLHNEYSHCADSVRYALYSFNR